MTVPLSAAPALQAGTRYTVFLLDGFAAEPGADQLSSAFNDAETGRKCTVEPWKFVVDGDWPHGDVGIAQVAHTPRGDASAQSSKRHRRERSNTLKAAARACR